MHTASILTLALAGVASVVDATAAGPVPGRRADLRTLLTDRSLGLDSDTTLSFPGGLSALGFTAATLRWSMFNPPTYSAAVTPATIEDVANIVRVARENNIPFLATGGRHGYSSTLARMTDGLAIDLSALDSVVVNQAQQTLTVGPGVVFADIFQPLYEAGLQIQTGVCSCPSMIGVTLGSGVGRLEGIYGLVADALESVRMVTAEGRIVDVSLTRNPELWWGLRGAGANFGIVVSATYRVQPLYRDGQFTVLDFILPPQANQSYFAFVEELAGGDGMPRDLSVSSVMHWNQTSRQPQIMANWVYNGPEDEARRALAPMFRLPALVTAVTQVPWSQLVATSVFGLDPLVCTEGQHITVLGANLRRVEASTFSDLFDSLVTYFEQYPDAGGSTLTIETFPTQGTESYPDDSSAYPWRSAKSLVMFQPVSAGPSKQQAFDWMHSARARLATRSGYTGYDGLRTYVNYAQGTEQLEQIYGADKLPRLAALKRTWDPSNVFRYMNPLPTEYP
ncbi:hypothetical protein S7711_02949 [Stachybotrys chartarum IBT 7711]|uniref:FAD-binding PCMH-type domain-containing protein n=1 Tax=Stachybotrys chartarum (strain CBS 109288 / IBT 7711) TaxID=1280523 RepID=A0A084B2E3_STACB|nr:hypothetical protein S7711_02949 [Stachybotrys chartarum IBT 7711]